MAERVLEFAGKSGAAARIRGVVLGRLLALRAPCWAMVEIPGRPAPLRARRVASLTSADRGRDVAVLFEEGDPDRAVVIGRIERAPEVSPGPDGPLTIDAESLVLQAGREIVLRCGDASITLRRDGRIVVRGAYVETRSRGVNRIKGGSVQIN